MSVTVERDAYGFLLVTTDPERVSGGPGQAWSLVQARLSKHQWPIYENTRGRLLMKAGARLAFYVAGNGKNRGLVVATAKLERLRPWRQGQANVDPEVYMTTRPTLVLELSGVHYLPKPVDFKARLPMLSFKAKNPKKWGVVLMGGCRVLSQEDYKALMGRGPK